MSLEHPLWDQNASSWCKRVSVVQRRQTFSFVQLRSFDEMKEFVDNTVNSERATVHMHGAGYTFDSVAIYER
ncbi:hypothetical protein ACGYTX_08135 [Burkholderia pseudomallei]